jgi:hypothetical protein
MSDQTLRRLIGALALVAVLGVGAVLALRSSPRQAVLEKGCASLHRARSGDADAFQQARLAFRDAVGGPFSGRLPYFALHATDLLEAGTSDPALVALAHGRDGDAERLFLARGGPAGDHGRRLARCLARAAGTSLGVSRGDW